MGAGKEVKIDKGSQPDTEGDAGQEEEGGGASLVVKP